MAFNCQEFNAVRHDAEKGVTVFCHRIMAGEHLLYQYNRL